MDKAEARRIAEHLLSTLRSERYDVLVERYLGRPEGREFVGESGTYQVEIEAFWDSGQPGDLRLIVAIDDGGLRALSPLTAAFIMSPDGTFIGE